MQDPEVTSDPTALKQQIKEYWEAEPWRLWRDPVPAVAGREVLAAPEHLFETINR